MQMEWGTNAAKIKKGCKGVRIVEQQKTGSCGEP